MWTNVDACLHIVTFSWIGVDAASIDSATSVWELQENCSLCHNIINWKTDPVQPGCLVDVPAKYSFSLFASNKTLRSPSAAVATCVLTGKNLLACSAVQNQEWMCRYHRQVWKLEIEFHIFFSLPPSGSATFWEWTMASTHRSQSARDFPVCFMNMRGEGDEHVSVVNTKWAGAIIWIGCNWMHATRGQMDLMVVLMLALNNEAFV